MTRLGFAPKRPTAELVTAIEDELGKRAVHWSKPHTGLSPAQRFVVRFEDGSSLFVKAAVDSETERWLRNDHLISTTLEEDFVPEVVAWIEAGPHSVLVMEDLRDAYWPADQAPVHWKPGQWEQLFATLERVAAAKPPASLPPLSQLYTPEWPNFAQDPGPLVRSGLCSARWLDASVDRLVAAEAALDLTGDALVHNDVRSDNLCFRGDRVILVDWSDARRGSAWFDLASLLALGQLEGGPDPYDVMPDAGPFAAWRGAELARRALDETDSPAWLSAVFRRASILCLTWAGKCLELPPWDGQDWRKV